MNRHRPDPPPPRMSPGRARYERVLRRQVLIVAAGNGLVGLILIALQAGTSPALAFLRLIGVPLPIWGGFYLTAAVLLATRRYVLGHTVAVVLWLFLAFGALVGLFTGATSSPAASANLAVLTAVVAGLHVNGLHWRRAQRLRAKGRQ